MSGAEKLKEKIIVDANSQAELVLNTARERAAAVAAKGEQEATGKKKSLLEQARTMAEERRRRTQTIAELDARKAILAAKEDLIEDTFNKAVARLQGMDQQAYTELILPMLLATAESGTEEIIISPRDKERFTPDLLAKANKALVAQGKQGKLALSAETREMQGGFVLRAGDVEINSSFGSILRMQRDQLVPEVAAILFE